MGDVNPDTPTPGETKHSHLEEDEEEMKQGC